MKGTPKIPAFLTRPITMPSYRRAMSLAFWGTLVGVLGFSGWYAWFSWHRYEQNSQYRLIAVIRQRKANDIVQPLPAIFRRSPTVAMGPTQEHPPNSIWILATYLKLRTVIQTVTFAMATHWKNHPPRALQQLFTTS
ncbi:hypothetical protein NRY68_17425 [Acidithiobacillus ferrooxidans]|uniref:hypothetical protein n=1 Tax=Acidithiobacillus ferrooxidans TaxID=920 RepID=UPI002148F731|nr:hypothetical protein [Acidithiobacillus ferrooxidans]MCR1347535.1 hypothetical protein [Acidithiobacillus ferrooxidans]MCR1355313.1 hypothetical protein [Acidithiobacillus ferrooxidans]